MHCYSAADMLEIPNLTRSPFDFVSFHLHFRAEDVLNQRGEDFYADSRWGEGVSCSGRLAENGQVTLAELKSEYDEESDLRVELTVQRGTAESSGTTQADTLVEVASALNELVDIRGYLQIEASYELPRSELPRQGIVALMIGLRTLVSGEELLLKGADFAIRGFPSDSLSWFVSREGTVRGTVTRRTNEELGENTLLDMLFVAQTRYARLILEQASQSHAVNQPVL